MSLTFQVEWQDAGAVRTPELRATWCRLEMWAGEDCISRVEEADTGASRRSIFVPLYPLAEWVAFNWWFLRGNHRPAATPTYTWSYRRLVQNPTGSHEWLRHHNLRATGEGFPWPDLTIVPEGEFTQIVWTADKGTPRGGLKYISSGEYLCPTDELQSSLASLVELVLTRMDELGVRETRLREEWGALQSLDADERAYCEAAGRLGVDPFNASAAVAESLELVGQTLSGDLLADFLDAADPADLRQNLDWVSQVSSEIEGLTGPQVSELTDLRDAVTGARMHGQARGPWDLGYAQARAAREALGLDDSEGFEVQRFVSGTLHPAPSRRFDAYGRVEEGVRLVLGRAATVPARRFASARALWHALIEEEGSAFLLTHARTTRQKIERAFAAELLAPAAGIGAKLLEAGPLWDSQDIEEIADHYGVQSLLVQRQIENGVEV